MTAVITIPKVGDNPLVEGLRELGVKLSEPSSDQVPLQDPEGQAGGSRNDHRLEVRRLTAGAVAQAQRPYPSHYKRMHSRMNWRKENRSYLSPR